MSKLIIFGIGTIAEVAYYYLKNDSPHEIAAFTVDAAFIKKEKLFGLPVIPFEDIEKKYPPDMFKMFIATGYQDLNKLRAAKYNDAKKKGYGFISYVSSKASNFGDAQIGENCLIMENQAIQPCSRIGNNVIIWSGNHIGHHSTIGDHCFITSHVVISGKTVIEPYCFIGVNSMIGHGITIGRESFIGANCLITKNAKAKSVYITEDTKPYALDSAHFLKFTKFTDL
jgi:sugar O-acyltransferase (sialic acid O-acetyltransferase NeuD family)